MIVMLDNYLCYARLSEGKFPMIVMLKDFEGGPSEDVFLMITFPRDSGED